MFKSSLALCTLLCAGLATVLPHRAAADDAAGPEAFFQHPNVRYAEISPLGDYLALVERLKDGRYALAVLPTANPTDAKVIVNADTTDIVKVRWVNENRLLFGTSDLTGDGIRTGLNGNIFSVERDGQNVRHLLIRGRGLLQFLQPGDPESDDVIVGKAELNEIDGAVRHISPYRLNTATGKIFPLVEPPLPALAKAWVFDTHGEPRSFVAADHDRRRVYYREKGSREWQLIGDFDSFSNEGFTPAFMDSNDALYVTAGQSGTSALYRYDVASHKLGEQPVLQVEGFDFMGAPVTDLQAKKILGFQYLTDAWGTYWMDDRMKAVQQKIDKLLPNTENTISCGNCLSSKFMLVTAVSDRDPLHYLLFNVETGQLVKVADTYPALRPAQMGRRDFATFTARDGLKIPVYVTKPRGPLTGPQPTIVLVHGGPWFRGASWEFSAIPQFLASRGYVVLEPEFRGSLGFGWKLYRSSWKQWGLAMQDDLADAAKWAIGTGLSDPKRIAIGGASYGGYATLMGLIKNPELFRCGFEWVGVTDIGLMYSVQWNDASIESIDFGMPILIGDPEKDAEQLRATSPLFNASRLTQPLLMAYGADDRRVPLVQGEKFLSAVSATNKNVEWIVYPGEGHGWYIEAHDIDFWKHVDRFLEANLKNATP